MNGNRSDGCSTKAALIEVADGVSSGGAKSGPEADKGRGKHEPHVAEGFVDCAETVEAPLLIARTASTAMLSAIRPLANAELLQRIVWAVVLECTGGSLLRRVKGRLRTAWRSVDADDVCGDAVVKTFEEVFRLTLSGKLWTKIRNPKTYIATIFRNAVRDEVARTTRCNCRYERLSEDTLADDSLQACADVDRMGTVEQRRRALNKLSRVDRIIANGRSSGHRYALIASTLGISIGPARVRMHRARTRLQRTLTTTRSRKRAAIAVGPARGKPMENR